MFCTLNDKLSILCVHMWQYSNAKQVYLHSDRTIYIKLKIELQTGSNLKMLQVI